MSGRNATSNRLARGASRPGIVVCQLFVQLPKRRHATTKELTQFFTDRSLYRPGQTIHYKGICLALDYDKDNYKTIAGRNLTMIFADVNGKEIERVKHRTNDYGSFSGSVTAPRDRLMGQMYLRVDGGPQRSDAGSRRRIQAAEVPYVELEAPKRPRS